MCVFLLSHCSHNKDECLFVHEILFHFSLISDGDTSDYQGMSTAV